MTNFVENILHNSRRRRSIQQSKTAKDIENMISKAKESPTPTVLESVTENEEAEILDEDAFNFIDIDSVSARSRSEFVSVSRERTGTPDRSIADEKMQQPRFKLFELGSLQRRASMLNLRKTSTPPEETGRKISVKHVKRASSANQHYAPGSSKGDEDDDLSDELGLTVGKHRSRASILSEGLGISLRNKPNKDKNREQI